MLSGQADEIRRAWTGGSCDHSSREPEYAEGGRTGSSVCCACGEEFWDGHPSESEDEPDGLKEPERLVGRG